MSGDFDHDGVPNAVEDGEIDDSDFSYTIRLAYDVPAFMSGFDAAQVWLQALTQNAWDTGAGWGLIVAYAIYARRGEDTALNAFMLGFGNNTVSLLAGIMVLCTVFSIRPDGSRLTPLSIGATGRIITGAAAVMTFVFLAFAAQPAPGTDSIVVESANRLDRYWGRGSTLRTELGDDTFMLG